MRRLSERIFVTAIHESSLVYIPAGLHGLSLIELCELMSEPIMAIFVPLYGFL